MRHWSFGAALVVFCASICDAEVRKWTDLTGKFSVDATLVEFKDGKVQLRRADGRMVTVPLEKLSPADQQYAKQQAAATPAAQEKPKAPGRAAKEEPAALVWTTDLARMRVPESKASGKIHGQGFVLDAAEFDNGILTLRQGKDFFPDLALKVFLFLKDGESIEGKTYRVRADQGFGNPHVHVEWRTKKGEGLPETEMIMGKYAMILEFGKIKEGRLPGRIYVCLPDKTKSFVAGTFVVGDAGEELGAEIFGSVSIQGLPQGAEIEVGCLGRNPEGKLEGPAAALELGGSTGFMTCTTWKPRNSTLAQDRKTGRLTHRHVNRPPGKYLVYARGNRSVGADGTIRYEGYYDWKWVEIKNDKSKLSVDLTIDPSKVGTVEVTVGGPTKQSSVTYLPLDESGQLPLADAHQYLQESNSAKLEGGKAIIRGLREGKYQVTLGPWQPGTWLPSAKADVEVKRGATTKLELKPR